ncbi:hypothetical protein J3R30DRAFT_3473939 [Lentinula aciculospora]|uniref:UBC core domain-containing protein n=1 Tax=Lentinula aciculospora TaxID=153920 RepID=A0A9W9ABS2_9AGAR|nr:hypothetical protein J3R30DRAFT_3473939 [Lentinula aciculospora]
MPSRISPVATLAGRNTALKGRKRFAADLDDLQKACTQGFVAHGLVLSSVRSGDDEGTFEAVIKTSSSEHVVNVNILLSDMADYPKTHTCFSYSPDSPVAVNIQSVIDGIASFPSQSLAETMDKVLANLGKPMSTGTTESDPEDEDDEEDYAFLSDDDVHTSSNYQNLMRITRLQHDFLEIVAREYRPGLIRFGGDDFCISVSLSIIKLTESVPARALNAWDRRLLSKTQNLVLLISGFRGVYPPSASDAAKLKFHVGLSGSYKPSKENSREACRNFSLITNDAEDQLQLAREKAAAAEAAMIDEFEMDEDDLDGNFATTLQEEEEEDVPDRFDKFSLSGSLDSLMNHQFVMLVNMRRKYGLGWAGAERLFSEVEKSQKLEEEVLAIKLKEIQLEDQTERAMIRKKITILPDDPLYSMGRDDEVDWPLTAFCYLVRRLTLCTRYCIVCHNKLETEYVALKPYVCDSKLCSYQYYSLNHGPSLEYEIIHKPDTVDLLVSITYAAAVESVLDHPLPIGMGLRVPLPDVTMVLAPPPTHPAFAMRLGTGGAFMSNNNAIPTATAGKQPKVDSDGLCEFDDLDLQEMRASVAQLLNSLPSVSVMFFAKKHLKRKVKPGKSKPTLATMLEAADVVPAAWKLLRWCVGSCTAHLEEISSQEESIKNVESSWKQYRFSVGAPDAEAKFNAAVEESKIKNENAQKYPSLYAFHGSPVRNWHSIIRNGLWFKSIANGRAYGNGVYLAKDGIVSMGGYAAGSRAASWRNSKICPTSCVALVELVNLPSEFVSSTPHFVVDKTHWLVVRYLLVKSRVHEEPELIPMQSMQPRRPTPFVKLDPAHPVTLGRQPIQIPEPTYQLESTILTRQSEAVEDDLDYEDNAVFEYVESSLSGSVGKGKGRVDDSIVIDDEDEMDFEDYASSRAVPPQSSSYTSSTPSAAAAAAAISRHQIAQPKTDNVKKRPVNDWVHNPEYVRAAISKLMPPPEMSTPSATMAVQKELKALLKEQNSCSSLKELGWYMPEEFIGDNLFQWIVELHSFDATLPIAQDLKARKLNSVIFEIRFPPDYPLGPPFFRIITPRFLPFIRGGGGHVTGGGSICMDLLTSSGWLPSYNIASVLLQIKLAISNLDPRPARLAENWHIPYGVMEALEGYKRAAATHQWIIPAGLEKLVR